MLRHGLVASMLAVVLLLTGPVGTRAGLWPFVVGFLLLALSLLLGLVGASLGLMGGIRTGQWLHASVAIVVGLGVVSVPSLVVLSARGAPPIHDISTDTDDPPRFVAVLALRAGAANPPEYAGPAAAEQQQRAYPDLRPVDLRMSHGEAFARVLDAVRDVGWELVASDEAAGRIEAVDTTFWFGFKDDVVIRLRPVGEAIRVDVRSKSRVGVGDVGTNARRIRELLRRVQS